VVQPSIWRFASALVHHPPAGHWFRRICVQRGPTDLAARITGGGQREPVTRTHVKRERSTRREGDHRPRARRFRRRLELATAHSGAPKGWIQCHRRAEPSHIAGERHRDDRRVIDAQTGPVVVVGHSYGGAVITGAAAGSPNVKSLVYVAAFAPDANEPVGAFNAQYPTALGPALRPDAASFLYIDVASFHDVFAADVPLSQTRVMAVTQKPLIASAFGESVPVPAWKSIPTWYIVAKEDQAIHPDLERFYAKRMGATTIELRSSHVPFISRTEEVAKVIRDAAEAP
jgi:pimeloyl-ACP methyl ester carboxylesterase